jgi:hypothetical protein
MKSSRNHTNAAATVGLILGFLLVAAVLGLGAAIFPTGFMARLGIIAFGTVSVILAWAFRSPKNASPATFIFVGLILLTALSVLWPRYIYLHMSGLPSISLFTFATMMALYIVIILLLYSPTFSSNVGQQVSNARSLFVLTGIWLCWRLLACILSAEPIYSLTNYVRDLIYLSSFFLFGCCLASNTDGKKWLTRILVLCTLLVGSAGLLEAINQHNIFVRFASAGDNDEVASNLANIALEKFRGGQYRAQATFNHPIVFAQYVSAAMPLVVYSILCDTSRSWRLLALVTGPIALAAIAQSTSRAGIVSVAAAMALIGIVLWLRAITHGKTSRAMAIALVPALISAIGVGYFMLGELTIGRNTQEAGSTKIRIEMLRLGIAALEDSPLWGFGQGMAVLKAGFTNSAGVSTIDNYFLSIAIESGYIGFLLFVILLLIFLIKSVKISVVDAGPDGLFVGACAASVAALALTFTVLSIPNNMTMLWLLMAATFPYMNRNSTRKRTSQKHIDIRKLA